MACFEDLSPYSYLESAVRPGTQNVGWLDFRSSFPKGAVAASFLDRLWLYCKSPVARTRGVHNCNFCGFPECLKSMFRFHGDFLRLGTAEIRVFGDDGHIYASPDLMFHYIRDHSYLPPAPFLQAVLTGPAPGTEEYTRLLRLLAL